MNIRKVFSSLVLCMTFSSGIASADREAPEVTVDGLHRVHDTEMALVYAKPGVDLSQYKRLHIGKPQVAFQKDWQRTQNSTPHQTVRNEDMQRIKSELATLFIEVFKQELQGDGAYELTEDFAEDVLIVRPAIIDLDISAPDVPGTRNSRGTRAVVGSMTLYMELVDSVTGDILVKALDNQYRRDRSPVARVNRARNEAAARDMLGEWAKLLRLALDEARAVITTSR